MEGLSRPRSRPVITSVFVWSEKRRDKLYIYMCLHVSISVLCCTT